MEKLTGQTQILVVTLAKLARPGGVRAVMAESLLLKQQLLISRRSRRRAPPLITIDRFVLGLTTLFVRPGRVAKVAAVIKSATLLRFHKALVDAKYRRLFSSAGAQRKLGAKMRELSSRSQNMRDEVLVSLYDENVSLCR